MRSRRLAAFLLLLFLGWSAGSCGGGDRSLIDLRVDASGTAAGAVQLHVTGAVGTSPINLFYPQVPQRLDFPLHVKVTLAEKVGGHYRLEVAAVDEGGKTVGYAQAEGEHVPAAVTSVEVTLGEAPRPDAGVDGARPPCDPACLPPLTCNATATPPRCDCAGVECPPGQQCRDGKCQCLMDGESCSDGAACCSKLCTAGKCVPDCLGKDATCDEGGKACCAGLGCCPENRKCEPRCCAATGAACQAADDCCSKLCFEGKCTDCIPVGATCPGSGCCAPSECTAGKCCLAVGQSCAATSECCGDATCSGGKCTPACKAKGGDCQKNGDCCAGVCSQGKCADCFPDGLGCPDGTGCCAPLSCKGGTCQCLPDGDSCKQGAECCNKTCCDGKCSKPADCCVAEGTACQEGGRACCGGAACCNGTCSSAPTCCAQEGNRCDTSASCCAGVCHEGSCAACYPEGAACPAGDGCCQGSVCQDGKCIVPCKGAGGTCQQAEECCGSLRCCDEDGSKSCKLPPGQSGCKSDGDCCRSSCVGGVCCAPVKQLCGAEGDCCGGLSCSLAGLCCVPDQGTGCNGDSGNCCNGPFELNDASKMACEGDTCCRPAHTLCNSGAGSCCNGLGCNTEAGADRCCQDVDAPCGSDGDCCLGRGCGPGNTCTLCFRMPCSADNPHCCAGDCCSVALGICSQDPYGTGCS